MTTWHFIEPLDVLFLRGNRLFGDPGSYGESFVPPWPSVAAGAIRSALLTHKGHDLGAFSRGEVRDPELGTPAAPGPFTLTAFHLGRVGTSGEVEPIFQTPADLVISGETGKEEIHRLAPRSPADGVLTSAADTFPALPILAQKQRSKPAGRVWLRREGYARYLRGEPIASTDLIRTEALWRLDARIGVGLDRAKRRAADGKLFTHQAVAFIPGTGFIARVRGAQMPESLMLRIGGDGRAARMGSLPPSGSKDGPLVPEPDFKTIADAGRCRIVLTSPAIFPGGWRLPGTGNGNHLILDGISARVVSACIPRAEVISGWDVARERPKPAVRAVPAGSVYWLDDLQAGPGAGGTPLPDLLRNLVEAGLWAGTEGTDAARRAEGFNRFTIAAF